MTNPLDLLADGFPHGTVEGERRGCLTSACPASPLQCKEVASRYRSDMKFKRLYGTGLRGQDLVDALAIANGAGDELKRAVQAATLAVEDDARIDVAAAQLEAPRRGPEPRPRRERPVDTPISVDQIKRTRARRLTEDEQRELLDRRQAGATLAELAEWMGCTIEATRNRIRAAGRLFDVDVEAVDRPKRKPTLREELEAELASADVPGPDDEWVAPDVYDVVKSLGHTPEQLGKIFDRTEFHGLEQPEPAAEPVPEERGAAAPAPEVLLGEPSSTGSVQVKIFLEFDPLAGPWPIVIEADRIVIDTRNVRRVEARP
ncbi:MAG: hypothetical protein D3X82_16745 [Candidatus Leucobacter sulfamidivorax]|nr:hypothetical protein [Candidatus Leucobacter sulfamidivorax]